jgi:hypothetical protein
MTIMGASAALPWAARGHRHGRPGEITTAPAAAGCPPTDMPAAAARAIRITGFRA